ncbi:hypothetical protein [Rhizobium sp. P28RR-XV]|uniref:hypothetical protein n=1 Tax=Rhizobium sp. P28RR-XV TaxID=2726737 RepID=UPI00197F5EC0|nr:hypothetical protein [Rhizobium sp. P28RR-XV]
MSPDIVRQLPAGYHAIANARLAAGKPLRSFEIIVLSRDDEDGLASGSNGAPARPLIVFENRDGQFVSAGRNDHVVMKADEGGQCDPFLDGGATIAVKGRYFTVENGVACGQHWTDYITFRLDDLSGGFVFDNERREAWELNPSNDPSAEVLVRAGPPRTIRDRSGKATPLVAWRPTG